MDDDRSNNDVEPAEDEDDDDEELEPQLSRLRTEFPELNSVLIRAEQSVGSSGCATVCGFPLIAAALGYSVNRGWLEVGLEGEVTTMVMIYLVALAIWLAFIVNGVLARLRYLGVRKQIAQATRSAGLSTSELIAEMAEESRFNDLLKRVCRDRRLDRELSNRGL